MRGAFRLGGYSGELRTLPLSSGDELCFVLPQSDVLALNDVEGLEQVLQQLLGCKVWVLASIEGDRHDNSGPTLLLHQRVRCQLTASATASEFQITAS